jgi:hypothetical protein
MHIKPTTQRALPVRARRGAIGALAALSCAALFSACGSSNSSTSTTVANLDTTRIAKSIEESVLTERHLHVSVTCPSAVPQEKGKTFVCIATSQTTKKPITTVKTPFTVTVQNDKGYVTYKGESSTP